jgi:hypothetical protein
VFAQQALLAVILNLLFKKTRTSAGRRKPQGCGGTSTHPIFGKENIS